MFNKNISVNILTSATTAVVFMSLNAYFNVSDNGSGAEFVQGSPTRSFYQDQSLQSTIEQLQESIDVLRENQQQLVIHNQELQQETAYLSDNQTDKDVDTLAHGNLLYDEQGNTDIVQQESELSNEATITERFDYLQEEVLQDSFDPAWDAEMDVALAEVEQRIQMMNIGTTAITSRDCRSSACLVEFTHEGEIDTTVLASLLAVKGTRGITLKQVQDGEQQRTVAIYKR